MSADRKKKLVASAGTRDQLIAEIVQKVGLNPDVSINVVYQRFTAMHQEAQVKGDDKRQAVLAETWDIINRIYSSTKTAVDIAAIAREMADAYQMDYETLLDAIRRGDESNPVVGDLAHMVREDHEDMLIDNGEVIFAEDLAWQMKQAGVAADEFDLEAFAMSIIGSVEVSTEKLDELGEFIKQWVKE